MIGVKIKLNRERNLLDRSRKALSKLRYSSFLQFIQNRGFCVGDVGVQIVRVILLVFL